MGVARSIGKTSLVVLLAAAASSHGSPAGVAPAETQSRRPVTPDPDREPAAVTAPVSRPPTERQPAGTSTWRLTRPATEGQIEGYTLDVSADPGERVPLRVSTTARHFRVEAYRFGDYDGGDARLVWSSRRVAGHRQPGPVFSPRATRTVTAPWRNSLLLPTTGWPPGAYVLKLVASSGLQAQVPFFVRSPDAVGKVALVAPVTSWQAYNTWGGYSLYTGQGDDRRSWAVSFDRPYPAPGAGQMMFGVRSVVVRAERLGVPLAYLTNVDLDTHRGILSGATGYVSMGHDEYWTPGMRQSVLDARDAGTNLAFLGADTMYWRIRLERSGTGPDRVVVGYRYDAHLDPMTSRNPAVATTAFRDAPVRQPESALTGMQYECFPVDAPYRVASPTWWGFAGTGVHRGTEFDHLVGVEADRVYPVASTPRPLEVLSDVAYSCGGVDTSSQSVYYTTPSGAGVFNSGTLRWTCALSGDCPPYTLPASTVRFTRMVTDNVLRTFAGGPAGERHPAHDNMTQFDLPRVNEVPAS